MSTTENVRTVIGKTLRKRWFTALVGCISLGGAVVYLLLNKPKTTSRYENTY